MAYDKKEIKSFKEIIIEGLSEGQSLAKVLKNNKNLPSRQTIYNWLNSIHDDYDSAFLDDYVRAREESADVDAERIQEIAEKTLSGEYDAASARVALDAFKWSASKKQPKKYGDKVDVTSGGEKLETPTITINKPSDRDENKYY